MKTKGNAEEIECWDRSVPNPLQPAKVYGAHRECFPRLAAQRLGECIVRSMPRMQFENPDRSKRAFLGLTR